MDIYLNADLEARIRRDLASGQFPNATKLIEEALYRMYDSHDAESAIRRAPQKKAADLDDTTFKEAFDSIFDEL